MNHLVRTAHQLQEVENRINEADAFGFDTESSGPSLVHTDFLNVWLSSMTGASFAFDDGNAFYVPIRHLEGGNLEPEKLIQLLNLPKIRNREVRVVAHLVKHELQVLKREGIDSDDWRYDDTQVLAWMLCKPTIGFGLKPLAREHLGMEMLTFNQVVPKGQTFGMQPSDRQDVLQYACDDATAALGLFRQFLPELEHFPHESLARTYYDLEMPFVRVLRHIEDTGMVINRPYLAGLADELTSFLQPLQEEWAFLTDDINPQSPKQLQRLFSDGTWCKDGIDFRIKSGQYATNAETMESLMGSCPPGSVGRTLASLRLEMQAAQKLLGTYTHKLVTVSDQYPDARLHSNFNQTGTRTGRLSSSSPNLQNIPTRTDLGKKILGGFEAPEGCVMTSADYSQIELRVLAFLAGKGGLQDEYARGEDVHQATATLLGIDRFAGKTMNFASVYGAGPSRIASLLGVSKEEGARVLASFWDSRKDLSRLRNVVLRAASARGYIRTLAGRQRKLPYINHKSRKLRGADERRAFNTPIQGGARDIVHKAMLDLYTYLKKTGELGTRVNICGQVHDDILDYVDESVVSDYIREKKRILESAWDISPVPLIAEPAVGKNWREIK